MAAHAELRASKPAPPVTAPRIVELDAIRGIAIVLVLIFHYLVAVASPQPGTAIAALHGIFDLAWAGVDLFFVLSGFLIGGILIKNRDAENYFATFYLRRAARLMPLYLAVVALYVAVSPWLLASHTDAGIWLVNGKAEPLPVWSYLLYVQNGLIAQTQTAGGQWLGPTWSLAVEEQFYLLAPWLVRLVPPHRLVPVLLGLIVAGIACRCALFVASQSWIPGYVTLIARWDSLFIGVLAAYAMTVPSLKARLEANTGRLPAMAGLLLAGLAILAASGMRLETPAMATFGLTYISVTSLATIGVALLVKTWWTRALFRNALLVRLGAISYGIYLLHMPVYGLVCLTAHGMRPAIGGPTDVGLALLAFTITCALAEVSWRWLEKPILELGQSVRYRQAQPV